MLLLQKNYRCPAALEIDYRTRELIKNITIICPYFKSEIIYSNALDHIQACFGNNSNSGMVPSAFNPPITDSREKFRIDIKKVPVEKQTSYLCYLDALLISTLEIILGIMYLSIIIENLPPISQYVDGNKKKDKMIK